MLLGSPKYFVHWHVFNQGINAGINYGNRNASTPLSNAQIVLGFGSAVLSATLAVTFLKARIASIIGRQGMMSNLVVNATAGGIASFVNTNCIRYGETQNGIPVFKDEA
jgi:hypothetical protein